MKPKCIVLDEATAMLDPLGRKEVMSAIIELNKVEKITVILITHYMDEAVLADKIFVTMCQDILENGTSTEGEKVRPHWEDGTSAYTIKKFGVVNRYDLSKEFPAITLRKTAIKTCTEEMLWIWQRKSNNIHDLNSTVWDEWADENGSIGKAYGYQLAQKHQYREGMMDQVDRVLYDLKHNPASRRILTCLLYTSPSPRDA